MPPKHRKRCAAGSSPPSEDAPLPTAPKRETWSGWCEVESEPAFFNTILRDIGVQSVKVQEVLGLDDELLAILPKPVMAMIFLFRYRETGKEEQGTHCPSNIWFANQVPEYACASVALLNIVMNIPDVQLGPELRRFKDFTKPFSPVGRGDAVADFAFVRNIHNSFAREKDMLNVDSLLKEKHAKLLKKQKMAAANAGRAAKAAERAAQKAEEAASRAANGTRKANPSRRARTNKPVAETLDSTDDDGFHFIAYMPINGEVWKLDGMDNFPKSLGNTPAGADWLSIAQSELMALMLQYQEGQIEFSLMAVVEDPIISVKQQLAENIKTLREIDSRLDRLSSTWRSFTMSDNDTITSEQSTEFDISLRDIDTAAIPGSIKERMDTDSVEGLLRLRQDIITAQAGCRAAMRDQSQFDREDATKAMHRRYDYGSFVEEWLGALAEEDVFSTLLSMD